MPADVWSKYHGKTVKPIYLVARSREEAIRWADGNLKKGLAVKSVSRMARQLAPHVYTGEIKA